MCDFCREAWRKDDDLPTFSARVERVVGDALWDDRSAWLGDFIDGYIDDDEDWDYNFVHTRAFQKFVIGTAMALDLYPTVEMAVLYRSLAGRYNKVHEWSFDILCAAYWESSIETPDEEHVKEYWTTRVGKTARVVEQIGAGQQSWL